MPIRIENWHCAPTNALAGWPLNGTTLVTLEIRLPTPATEIQGLSFEDLIVAVIPHLEPEQIKRILAAAAEQRLSTRILAAAAAQRLSTTTDY